MKPDNTEIRIESLVSDYKAYNDAIDRTRSTAQQYASEKAWTVGQLRDLLSVSEIADRLGITPPAVYSLLNEVPSDYDPGGIPAALRRMKAARISMNQLVEPITDQGVTATSVRLDRAGTAIAEHNEAWAGYVRALRAEGRPVPNRIPF
jgi:hypothetical protein